MRQIYVPDKETYRMYHSFFNNQNGAGDNPGGYVYNNHHVGGGLDVFFRSALTFSMPIGKNYYIRDGNKQSQKLKRL